MIKQVILKFSLDHSFNLLHCILFIHFFLWLLSFSLAKGLLELLFQVVPLGAFFLLWVAVDVDQIDFFLLIFFLFIVASLKVLQQDGREEREEHDVAKDHEDDEEHDSNVVRDR